MRRSTCAVAVGAWLVLVLAAIVWLAEPGPSRPPAGRQAERAAAVAECLADCAAAGGATVELRFTAGAGVECVCLIDSVDPE